MVGHRGDRINTVLSLPEGEKRDYKEDKGREEELVADSLKPARGNKVELDNSRATVYLDDDQK